jgi:hypothetical protein
MLYSKPRQTSCFAHSGDKTLLRPASSLIHANQRITATIPLNRHLRNPSEPHRFHSMHYRYFNIYIGVAKAMEVPASRHSRLPL